MPNNTDIEWVNELTPQSTRFADTYYSRTDGLAESRYVFINGNKLASRWSNGENPVIGELGFGTGLNFLATWYEALEKMGKDKMGASPLTFVSCEKFPLECSHLTRALSNWPELQNLVQRFLPLWRPDWSGWQKLDFGTATLHLFIGDAKEMLMTIPHRIDSWYLDGFNPKTNSDLWSLELMQQLHGASNKTTTLASYTAAGWVRRNLAEAGFEIAKRKGFGHKRDMITGHLRQA